MPTNVSGLHYVLDWKYYIREIITSPARSLRSSKFIEAVRAFKEARGIIKARGVFGVVHDEIRCPAVLFPECGLLEGLQGEQGVLETVGDGLVQLPDSLVDGGQLFVERRYIV